MTQGDRPVFDPADGGGTAPSPLWETEDVATKVAVSHFNVRELGAFVIEHFDADFVELDKPLHDLGKGLGVEEFSEQDAPLKD
jgi:hypothetical protein